MEGLGTGSAGVTWKRLNTETDQKYEEKDQKFEETDQQNEIFKVFEKNGNGPENMRKLIKKEETI